MVLPCGPASGLLTSASAYLGGHPGSIDAARFTRSSSAGWPPSDHRAVRVVASGLFARTVNSPAHGHLWSREFAPQPACGSRATAGHRAASWRPRTCRWALNRPLMDPELPVARTIRTRVVVSAMGDSRRRRTRTSRASSAFRDGRFIRSSGTTPTTCADAPATIEGHRLGYECEQLAPCAWAGRGPSCDSPRDAAPFDQDHGRSAPRRRSCGDEGHRRQGTKDGARRGAPRRRSRLCQPQAALAEHDVETRPVRRRRRGVIGDDDWHLHHPCVHVLRSPAASSAMRRGYSKGPARSFRYITLHEPTDANEASVGTIVREAFCARWN